MLQTDLPPLPGRIAVVLGFLLGTWMLLDGAHRLIAGDYIRVGGQLGPWARIMAAIGIHSIPLALLIAAFGIAWLVIPNLYLFQNQRRVWIAVLVLALASAWYVGGATPVLAMMMLLLLLPATRRGLRS